MIRKATVLDLPAVKEIYNYAVLNTTATYDINPKDDKYFVDMLNEHTGKYLLSVYEENGNVIGYVALSRYSKKRCIRHYSRTFGICKKRLSKQAHRHSTY